jgi:hypothetical protein
VCVTLYAVACLDWNQFEVDCDELELVLKHSAGDEARFQH